MVPRVTVIDRFHCTQTNTHTHTIHGHENDTQFTNLCCLFQNKQCPHSNRVKTNIQYTCGEVWDLCMDCYKNCDYCPTRPSDGGTKKYWTCNHPTQLSHYDIGYTCGHVCHSCDACFNEGDCLSPFNDGGRIKPVYCCLM